jgi:hypothetical protein
MSLTCYNSRVDHFGFLIWNVYVVGDTGDHRTPLRQRHLSRGWCVPFSSSDVMPVREWPYLNDPSLLNR